MKLSQRLKDTISKEVALQILQKMLTIRELEKKCAKLYTEEKIRGFLHLYIGEEAIASTIITLLDKHDQIFATYREHAHAYARGISLEKIIAEMFGKATGCSKGRGGSMHLFDVSKSFYGGSAIVAGHIPLAVGMAMANKRKKNDLISVCFFGEGAVNEGVFHESINIAVLWKLPILFICENNYYAMGTAIERSQSQINLIEKVKSYKIHAIRVNGMSVVDLYSNTKEAINYVRSETMPFFLECSTYRFNAHSMFDPQLYRSMEEVERWKKDDPINNYLYLLKDLKWIDKHFLEKIHLKISNQISRAIDFASESKEETFKDVLGTKYAAD